jgi:hypothetical protein
VTTAQKDALTAHRQRRRDSGLARVEVQVPAIDAALIRDVAAVLREPSPAASALREQMRVMIAPPRASAVFDIFGSDLPDSYFDGVFEKDRHRDQPRDLDL